MKITIPKEYDGHFNKKVMWLNLKDKKCCATKEYTRVFVSRWKDHSLLILSEKEYENLLGTINTLKHAEMGLKRFLEAGIEGVLVNEGQFTLPDWALEWIGSGNIKFSKNNQGFINIKVT